MAQGIRHGIWVVRASSSPKMCGNELAKEEEAWMLAKWTLPMLELSSNPKTAFAVLTVMRFATRVMFLGGVRTAR